MANSIDESLQINLGPGMTWVPPNDPPILLPGNGTDSENPHLVALAEHFGKHADKWEVAVITSDETGTLVSTLATYVPEVSTVPLEAGFEFLDGLTTTPLGARSPYAVFLDEGAGKALSEGEEGSQRMETHLRMGRSLGIHFIFVGYPHRLLLDFRY